MTNEEAINTIKIAKAEVEWCYPLDYQIAFDMAIKLLKKQIPKQPVFVDNCGNKSCVARCPECFEITSRIWVDNKSHCKYCGQVIDWSEVTE